MTVEEMKAMLQRHSEEYLSFSELRYKPHTRPDVSAMLTLDRLDPGSIDMVSSASHDEIWFEANIETVAANATPYDIKLLAACRVRIDGDSFAMFV